jgi:predicted RNA binding protein YcfA (HicA-like mRNA interferase family)
MAFRPLKTNCWIKFLELHGFKNTRIKGSHFQFVKKGSLRSIPVWGSEKEIPAMHLKTGCMTIGCTLEELYKWAEKNC